MVFRDIETIVVGTGASGYNAADLLSGYGVKDLAIITESKCSGTSRNTGSDKQTYYKLSLSGEDLDSVRTMAMDLFRGKCGRRTRSVRRYRFRPGRRTDCLLGKGIF